MPKILIVDDDEVALATAGKILENCGYSIDLVQNLCEAKQRISQTEYSAVITDMNMPDAKETSAIEVLHQLKCNLEIIVVSGYGTLDVAVKCMRAGASDFLIKPVSRNELVDAIERAVGRKEISRENVMLRGLNEMKDKFLTLVSHELRTPLTLIYGYLTILQRQSASLSTDQVDLLQIIMKSSKQLINIVNNIQTIAQADSGEMKIHVQSVLPRKLLADVLAEMKASISQRNLDIQLEAGKELEPFAGDPIRLHQVISELVQNSIRNTEDGGRIILGTFKRGEKIILWVRDTGIGIPAEEQSKIFEPFYEVADVKQHTSSNSRFGGGGIGIGLPLVRRVVEAHGGTIELDSTPGRGTTIELFMPVGTIAQNTPEFTDKLD